LQRSGSAIDDFFTRIRFFSSIGPDYEVQRVIRYLGAILICWSLACDCSAEEPASTEPALTLTDQLIAEDASELAVAARERGDAVRGAILFSQQSTNCTTCHAQGSQDLMGPDLTRVGISKPDEHFVESILQPSRTIEKEFRSVKILTDEGRVVRGRIVREDKSFVVLRDLSRPERLTQIAKNDIEQIRPEAVSAMPERLADQLDNRQQFLDLVRYVMEIAGTERRIGSETPLRDSHGSQVAAAATIEDRVRGVALLEQFGCTQCHRDTKRRLPPKLAPDLASVATRVDPVFLQRFIGDPTHVKPGTSMPDVMSHLTAAEREDASTAITHFLDSLSAVPFQPQPIDTVAASRGHELFHSVGCVACHAPRRADGIEVPAVTSVALGDVTEKYSVSSLTAFLEDPHAVRPSGRMPSLSLSHFEATDLANFLLQTGTRADRRVESISAIQLDSAQVSRGKELFTQLRCANCHLLEAPLPQRPAPDLATLNSERGCLSNESGPWPSYPLESSQRQALQAAIVQNAEPLSDQQQLVVSLESFRCFRCHQRDDLGGVAEDRDLFFKTTNENLGPQGRLPPTLTGVGGKLKPKWLRDVLVSGRSIRPYMMTRMPQYGARNVAHLVDRFARADKRPPSVSPADIDQPHDPKETRKVGAELVGKGGLNCIACHTFKHQPAQTMPAVDLTEMAERLQKEWFVRYMRSPQSLSPNTVMPSFWPGGRAIRKTTLGGDADRQIDAIWEYLLDGRQARTPSGLRIEPIELVASDGRTVMLRRSYRDVGKRGIGVGYPRGVNLVFDAEQMRLAMIWKGKFADPGGVWRSQGHGTVRPLGHDLIRFPPGPDLDDAASPWQVDGGRPPDHQFMGYDLDDQGRPTFLYRFGAVEVRDALIDPQDDGRDLAKLKRTLTFSAPQSRPGMTIRVARGTRITDVDGRTFVVDDTLQLRVEPPYAANVTTTETGKLLNISIDLPRGKSELILHYRW
jgi:putative heme-binding domain-containing protein